jgi:hypothetical protein
VTALYIMAENMGEKKLLPSWNLRNKAREKEPES